MARPHGDNICPACGEKERFVTSGGSIQPRCRDCWNEYQRELYARRKAEAAEYRRLANMGLLPKIQSAS